MMPLQIDILNLQMDRLVFKDYSAGKEPSINAYEINLKKSYKDISSVEQLLSYA